MDVFLETSAIPTKGLQYIYHKLLTFSSYNSMLMMTNSPITQWHLIKCLSLSASHISCGKGAHQRICFKQTNTMVLGGGITGTHCSSWKGLNNKYRTEVIKEVLYPDEYQIIQTNIKLTSWLQQDEPQGYILCTPGHFSLLSRWSSGLVPLLGRLSTGTIRWYPAKRALPTMLRHGR